MELCSQFYVIFGSTMHSNILQYTWQGLVIVLTRFKILTRKINWCYLSIWLVARLPIDLNSNDIVCIFAITCIGKLWFLISSCVFKTIISISFFLHNYGKNMWECSCGPASLSCNVHVWWFISRQWKQQLFGVISKSGLSTKWVWLWKKKLHGSILQWQNTSRLHW